MSTDDHVSQPSGQGHPAPKADPIHPSPIPKAPTAAPGKRRDRLYKVRNTKTAHAWTGLVVGAVLGVLLLVFILQNSDSTQLNVFFWEWNMSKGVAILFAAIIGALLTALIGGARMFQIRRAAKTP